MHGDLESFFGGGHEIIHYDSHLHDPMEEAVFPVLGAAEGVMQVFSLGDNFAHLLHDTIPATDFHSHFLDHQDHQAGAYVNDYHDWHDVGGVGHDVHLHILRHSEAQDSNSDGVSDAASRDLGIDPYNVHAHQPVVVDWHDTSGSLHHSSGKDSDGDGWSDDLERLAGTNPYDGASHPSLVEAHHYPAGSDENLPGTIDVVPAALPWRLP